MVAIAVEQAYKTARQRARQVRELASEALPKWKEIIEESCREIEFALSQVHVALEHLQFENRKLTSLRKQLDELESMRGYFLSQPQACLVTDLEGNIREANECAAVLLNRSRESMIGRSATSLVQSKEPEATIRETLKFSVSADTTAESNPSLAQDQAACDRGVRRALCWVFCDLTATEMSSLALQQIKRFRKAAEVAERASRAKTELLARMSHELRTPLTSVIGFSNLLLKRRREEKEIDPAYLEKIVSGSLDLLNLLNQITDLSMIECGQTELEKTVVQLPELIQEVADQMRQSTAPRTELRVEIPSEVEPVETDRTKLKEVLLNLVGNALKFTEEGSVVLRVETEAERRRPVRLEVSDTGIGIPENCLESIFEPFHQADRTIKSKYGGSGLGLSICRSFCALMGYKLGVRSRLGEGSTFTIELT